ncbi:MAG: hypothetical protein ACOC2W_00720 [bacterium]
MKIAHFGLWAPNRSGLHEATVEQILYERKEGLDSYLIHSEIENPDPNRFTDLETDITAKGWDFAMDADVWVMHRTIPAKLMRILPKKKNIAILHGTSEIMVMHEVESGGKNDKFNMHIDFLSTFQKVITITKSDTKIMKLYDKNNSVVYINDSIDTNKYSPIGHGWNFRYRPAIISTTNVRINKNPSPLIWAMPRIIEEIPKARLNMFGLNLSDINIWRNIVLKSGPISIALENIHNQFFDLTPFLRGADISFNSNYSGIFSRDSMEALSCGCSVVAYTSEHTNYVCHRETESIVSAIKLAWEDLKSNPKRQIEKNKQYALDNFSWKKNIHKYIDLYNKL